MDIVAKTKSELNLTRRQTALFQKIILVGNQMSDLLRQLDEEVLLPKRGKKLPLKWAQLMIQLVNLLI